MTTPRRRSTDPREGMPSEPDLAETLKGIVRAIGRAPDPILRDEGSGLVGAVVEIRQEQRLMREAFDAAEAARKAGEAEVAEALREEKHAAENSPLRRITWHAVSVTVAILVTAAVAWVLTLHH